MAYVRTLFDYSPVLNIFDPKQQTTAHFGALVFGSDIDGRQMRGKGDSSLQSALDDLLALSRHPTGHHARRGSILCPTAHLRLVHL
jgi:hypothetical protein